MTWIIVVCCKQKTAYEMRISDWSSDVCSSDLGAGAEMQPGVPHHVAERRDHRTFQVQAGARGERLDAGLRCRVEPDPVAAAVEPAAQVVQQHGGAVAAQRPPVPIGRRPVQPGGVIGSTVAATDEITPYAAVSRKT